MSLKKMNRSPWSNLWKEENEETGLAWRWGEEGDNLVMRTAILGLGDLQGTGSYAFGLGCGCVMAVARDEPGQGRRGPEGRTHVSDRRG